MTVDLSVEFCGVKFKHPFLLSASPATAVAKLEKAAKAGWAGAVTWSAEVNTEGTRMVGCALPHGVKYIDHPPAFWSFQASHYTERLSEPQKIERIVKKAKESGIPIIASVQAGLEPAPWVEKTELAEKAGADIIEVNLSYAISPIFGMHLGFARELDRTRQIVDAVKSKTNLPIMTKLSAFLIPQEIRDWAKACVESGASAISITNSIPGIAGVDIETGRPLSTLLNRDKKLAGSIGIVDGPGIRPIGLAGVAAIRSAVDVPISAIGGIFDWQSAVEYMMVGASTVQVGSAVLAYGYRMVQGLTRGLSRFMERKGYKTVDDFVGITSKKYRVGEASWDNVHREVPFKMVIDETHCTGCGRCVIACEASAWGAIRLEKGIPSIDQDACWRCRMCMLVCPEQAISCEWEPSYLK